ncbi:MAG TPA: phytoene/squalene synthase family protein [Gammaproteobacteria bacterium]|nr:phytoene/squalene synthase family protein [Gammaproteobacteria bacterium]
MQNKTLSESDKAFQQRLLQGVARSFALTIPQLPPELADTVANAYLLCRIADTLEDETAVRAGEKPALAKSLIDAVAGRAPAQEFVGRFYPRLGVDRLPAEKELIAQTARVIGITHGFSPSQRARLERCVRIMIKGMVYYQAHTSPQGLKDMAEFDRYCYHVAGVVGELLTGLCCQYSPALERERDRLMGLAVSFGQGLQMTNILRDIRKDLERGVCWLPRELFAAYGYDLARLARNGEAPAFAAGLRQLIAIAHGHLRNALNYTLSLPPQERGLRKFCYWSVAMALLTLRKIHKRPHFTDLKQVKIRRSSVSFVIAATALLQHSNRLLEWLFNRCAAGLPPAAPVTVPTEPHATVQAWFDTLRT